MATDPSLPEAALGMPPSDVDIDEAVVRDLIQSQFPQWRHLELVLVARGWDNVTYRLGDTLAVRLPRIRVAVDLLVKEQHFIPLLATQLPILLPTPVGIGTASSRFPRTFSVVPWLPGAEASRSPLLQDEAERFGTVLRHLHGASLPGLSPLPWRGGPLHERAAEVNDRLAELRHVDALPVSTLDQVRAEFEESTRVPLDVANVPIHADLHPKNILTDEGSLAAIIDWGDLNLGDPAGDLASVWMHFAPEAHAQFWAGYGCASESTLARARGWALFFGVNLLAAETRGAQDFGGAGARTLQRLLSCTSVERRLPTRP